MPGKIGGRLGRDNLLLGRAAGRGRIRLGARFGNMARQEDAERRALVRLGVDVDETAGLLDDAVDRGKSEPGAFADFLGRKERLKDLVDDLGRNAGAGVADLDPHIVRRRHALVCKFRDLGGRNV